MAAYRSEFIAGIDSIDAAQWDALAGDSYPFVRHAFLAALEHSGSVGDRSGWKPHHLVIRDESTNTLVAAMPAYLKDHSYGEYVFDWGWADAWHRNGYEYYPKLLSAIPFTPCSGPRLLFKDNNNSEILINEILGAVRQELSQKRLSSWHLLFPKEQMVNALEQRSIAHRYGVQYHWHNRGYQCFDDFLGTMSSRKRKTLRRERRQVEEQGIRMRTLRGSDISPADWKQFYLFYQMTYAKRSGHGGYLNQAFFVELAETMSDSLMLVMADHGDTCVGGALYLVGSDTLYGRYWGCIEDYNQLHFEACYYRGIDYCIANGLQRFDAGAQGEHKLTRGFEPILTHSFHIIPDPRFDAAIRDFLKREEPSIRAYCEQARDALPYRADIENGAGSL